VESTRAGAMFVDVQGRAAANGRSCRLTISFVSPRAVGRAGDAAAWAAIDAAQTLANKSWASQPSVREIVRTYPQAALDSGIDGQAALDCLVLEGGALRCAVSGEQPVGFGFGGAILRLSSEYRANVAGADVVGKRVHILTRYTVR